jgi:glycosyltransferase involved in cell wall biosynthesis
MELELEAILLAEGRLAQELRRGGIPVVVISEREVGRLGVVRGLARILGQHPVDVLHMHGYKESVLGVAVGRWAGVRRFVKTEHGRMEPWEGWDRLKMSFYQRLNHWTARVAMDRVIAVSLDLSRHLATSLPQGRVALIRNGLDPRRIVVRVPPAQVRSRLGFSEETPLLGAVGRLAPVKGLPYLLEAARSVLDVRPDVRFLLLGDGPMRSELEGRARALGIAHAVQFPGFVPEPLDIVNALDVFVMPSLHEGLPMALLEAMALGKAIVASAVGGIPEVLHGNGAWLVPPRDVPALTRACLAALASERHEERRAATTRVDELAKLGREMCAETFALYRNLARHNGES